jgi:hypothetical protein
MKIFLITDDLKIRENLSKNNKIELITMDEIIKFDGKEISVHAYEQIKKRDRNNLYIIEFKKKIMEIQLQKIQESDIVFIDNKKNLNADLFYIIIMSNYFNKEIIFTRRENTPEYIDIIKTINYKIMTDDDLLNTIK